MIKLLFPVRKSKAHIFLIFVFILSLGCINEKYVSKNYVPINKNTIGFLKPLSHIELITEKNLLVYDRDISSKASDILMPKIYDIMGENKKKKQVFLGKDVLEDLAKRISSLELSLSKAQDKKGREGIIGSFILPESYSLLFSENNIDQLVISQIEGFTRTKANFRSELVKNISAQVVTLGVYRPVSYKANTTLHVWVINAHSRKIDFRNMNSNYTEPLDEYHLTNNVCEVMQGMFSYKSELGQCFHY